MELGDSLRNRIEDRINDAVSKYFDGGFGGHVYVEKTASGFRSECLINLDTGMMLQASGQEMDATASFDAAAERIEKRLRRYKRRLKDHHTNAGAQQDAAYMIMQSPEEEEEIATDFNPIIIAESTTTIRTQTVAMAVMQLDLMDGPVHLFKNAANGAVNIVYRRNDGNIGWIDPSSISKSA
jgi:ribosomal subunit interface protein